MKHTHARQAHRSTEDRRYSQRTSRSSFVRRPWCRPRPPVTDDAVLHLQAPHDAASSKPRLRIAHAFVAAQANAGACTLNAGRLRCALWHGGGERTLQLATIIIWSHRRICSAIQVHHLHGTSMANELPRRAHSGGHAVDIRLRTGFH